MSSFAVTPLTKFGLIDDGASPATRAYVPSAHEDTEATIREPLTPDSDPEGNPYFGGFRSEIEFAGVDLDDHSQADTYMADNTLVKAVGVTPDLVLQWYHADRVLARHALSPAESALVQGRYVMQRAAGDQSDHDVYLGRNGLVHLAPENGGWADTDSDGTPDGYTELALVNTAFSAGVYEAGVDPVLGGNGRLKVQIPFPVDNVELTFSVEVAQLHDDGDTAIGVQTRDASKSIISGYFKTLQSTGRKSVTFTADAGTYFLDVQPLEITNASNDNQKAKIKNPALRVDGSDQYVAK